MIRQVYAIDITTAFPPAKNFNSIASFLNILIPNIMLVAGIILFILIIYTGFQYLLSGGKPESLKKIQQSITYGLVGFGIIIAAYLISKLVGILFNFTVAI